MILILNINKAKKWAIFKCIREVVWVRFGKYGQMFYY